MTDANDILMGSGAPAAKFEQIGATVTGTVIREPEARQQTDFRTGTPETWKDGSPKMQVVVQLKTELRDPASPSDDGTRVVYIKGKHLTDAIRQAVRASGANGLHTGGTLTVQYVGDGKAENGLNAPKLYAAQYQPPAVSFNGIASPTTTQPAAAASPQPATQQAANPQQAVLGTPPACPPGIDANTWARMDRAQQDRVLAALAPAGQTPNF